MNISIDSFVDDYVREIEAGNAAIFAGAGLSVGAGFVDWINLLRPLATDLGLDAEIERDHLIDLAQFYVNSNAMNRSELTKRLLEEFPTNKKPTKNHELLARLPIAVYWTTNYDRLIEKALEGEGKIPDAKYTVPQLAFTKPRRDAVVFKMHGDIEHPNQAVITKDDYERYPIDHTPFVTALSGDLVSRTFLFLGFSFSDPNLDYVLSRIRVYFAANTRKHYAIFRRTSASDFKTESDFEYASLKQRLAIDDLRRFNIHAILVDDYSEITSTLEKLENRFRRKSVFISGSAEEFGVWDQLDVEEFLSDLGRILVQKGYRVVSGFGLGISNALLSGATETIFDRHLGRFDDYLVVRPFPRYNPDPAHRKALWTKFRKDLISKAGIAIFLFGNKSNSEGDIVLADGVNEEYSIAKELDLIALPIGSTGYASAALGRNELANNKEMPTARRSVLEKLQEPIDRPQELLSRIVDVLDQVQME